VSALAVPRLFNPEYHAGETAELGDWLFTVTGLEATGTLTPTIEAIAGPRHGNFWLLDMQVHTERGNTLEGFQWAVITTQGTTRAPLGHGLYQVYQGEYMPVSPSTEWLSLRTTLNCLLVFDLPENTPPSWLLITHRGRQAKLKLALTQP
jgi:hypothetical protein